MPISTQKGAQRMKLLINKLIQWLENYGATAEDIKNCLLYITSSK